jgi:hypothetical protein
MYLLSAGISAWAETTMAREYDEQVDVSVAESTVDTTAVAPLEGAQAQPDAAQAANTTTEGADIAPAQNTQADRARRYLGQKIATSARALDDFFDSENHVDEEASTRLKLRHVTHITSKESTDNSFRASARVHLPGLSNRLSLVLEGNDDLSMFGAAEEAFDDPDDNTIEEGFDRPSIGLEYFRRMGERFDFRMQVGARANPALYFGPRMRYQHAIGKLWLGRYIQNLRWYTDEGWDSDTRVEFDRRVFGGNYLFRQSFRSRWREERKDDKGFVLTTTSALARILNDDSALRFQWSSTFFTEPVSQWKRTAISLRYRRQFWREWFFVEVIPEIAWEEEFDWDTNPGVRIAFEALISDDTP